MRHRFETRQWVPYPRAAVFDFFADPRNMPPLMPRWQRARIVGAMIVPPPAPPAGRTPTGHEAGAGSRLRISFRPLPFLPLRLRWDALIAEFAWDDHFCDEQISGPFSYWRHCHRLSDERRDGVGGTIVTDEVTFTFPLGLIGELAYRLGGARQVRAIFEYRQRQLLRKL